MVTAPETQTNLPTLATVWQWLAEVADPEIPVVSLVDLGIIQDIAWVEGRLEVVVTPTYSGCPATTVISLDIGEKIREKGIDDYVIRQRLVPAWTTDWISDEGRRKLRAYGITPPADRDAAEAPATIVTERRSAGRPLAETLARCLFHWVR